MWQRHILNWITNWVYVKTCLCLCHDSFTVQPELPLIRNPDESISCSEASLCDAKTSVEDEAVMHQIELFTDYLYANVVINLQSECPCVNRGYYAFVSRKLSGETHTQAHRHPHPPCSVPCLCHRHMLLMMSNTHIEGEGAERRRKGGRGSGGGVVSSGRELPSLRGERQQKKRGARMGTERWNGWAGGEVWGGGCWLGGCYGGVRGGGGWAGVGPHTCTKERQQLDSWWSGSQVREKWIFKASERPTICDFRVSLCWTFKTLALSLAASKKDTVGDRNVIK